jgi:hypothetical protein
MSSDIFYVYQYLDDAEQPYYIGKGSGKRINRPHGKILVPPINRRIILKDRLSNEEAKALERELIGKYKRKVDGGILDNIKINQWACAVGWKHSEETKQKISMHNTGKKRTAIQKANYSKPKSIEHSKNIKAAVKKIWADPEYRAKRMAQVMATRIKNGHSNG